MTHKITVATIISLVFTSFFLPRVVVGQRVAPRAVEDEHFATWRPAESDAVALDLEFARGLLARGLAELASSELARLESRVATESAEVRARFGALAATAALDSSLLDSSNARASVASRLGELRALVEGSDSTGYDYFFNLTEVDSAGLAYALAISRAYAYVGASGAPEFLDVALKITELLARSLPASHARPFVYRHAATLLATQTEDRYSRAEKFADALAKRSQRALDEYYFFARLLSIRIAREQGDVERCSALISETLDALERASARFDYPREIAVALVAEEIRLLLREGKQVDALRQSTRDTDLRDAPLPENTGRYSHEFYDVFDDCELARLDAYCAALVGTVPEEALEGFESADAFRTATLAASRASVDRITSSFARAQASRALLSTGAKSGDLSSLRAAGDELYRAGQWRAALDAYDRASSSARASGADEDAYQLDRVAAALVDKICRESLYESSEFDVQDGAYWRADASRRFEALSRARVTEPAAPDFYLLALDYRANTPSDTLASRVEFLRLFPDSPRSGKFALDLARRALGASEFEIAETALDRAYRDATLIPSAVELERALARARVERGGDRVETSARALTRIFNGAGLGDASQSLSERLARFEACDYGVAFLATTLELAEDSSLLQDAAFQTSALRALEVQSSHESTRAGRATLDALRLEAALASGRDADASALLTTGSASEGAASLELVERALAYASRAEVGDETKRRAAEFALAATERGTSEPRRRRLLRAEALRLVGKRQESLNLFAALRKEFPNEVGAARGIARILSSEHDRQTLERALGYWSEVAELVVPGSTEWWDAKEESVKLYVRLGELDQARKMTDVLWLTRTDPSDPGRKGRWEEIVRRGAEKPSEH